MSRLNYEEKQTAFTRQKKHKPDDLAKHSQHLKGLRTAYHKRMQMPIVNIELALVQNNMGRDFVYELIVLKYTGCVWYRYYRNFIYALVERKAAAMFQLIENISIINFIHGSRSIVDKLISDWDTTARLSLYKKRMSCDIHNKIIEFVGWNPYAYAIDMDRLEAAKQWLLNLTN